MRLCIQKIVKKRAVGNLGKKQGIKKHLSQQESEDWRVLKPFESRIALGNQDIACQTWARAMMLW